MTPGGRRGKLWSSEEIAVALDRSKSTRAIAYQLGRTVGGVHKVRTQEGLRRRKRETPA